jgi:hypothetical protein
MERNTTSIRMADEMHLLFGLVYQRDRPRRLIGNRKGVLATPWSAGVAAIVFRGQQLILTAKRFAEGTPLAAARARAMQSYDCPPLHCRAWKHTDVIWRKKPSAPQDAFVQGS